MSLPAGPIYRFGPFRYDAAQRALFRDDIPVPLVPKAADTLQALLERRGQIVSKADLMNAVWPDCVVEEVGLARNISLLRKALGDEADTYIETIPKRGYRFAADTHGGETRVASPHRRTWIVLAAGVAALASLVYWQFYRPSKYLPEMKGAACLAVVPFECLSPDLEREGFPQGLSDALTTEISRLPSVQVISPSTVRRYRSLRIPTPVMSRLLGLDVIVEGAVQRFGQQIRITVRLTDVHSGKLIWAGVDHLPVAELEQTETAAVRAVASQIGARLRAP